MTRRRTLGEFLLVTLLFGTAFPAITVGLSVLPPLLFAAARYAVSAVILLSYAVVTTDYWRPRSRRDWQAVAAGGALFIGGTGFTFYGQQFTTSGVAAIIVSLVPVLTVLVGWALLPAERPSRRGALGVVVGLVGVALVVRPAPASLLDPAVLGKLSILLAAVLITLGTVLVRRVHAPMPVPALTGWSMVVGATLQLAASAATGEPIASVTVTTTALLTVVYLGAVAGAFAFALYFALIGRVGALRASLVTYLNPVVALLTGWVFLGERVQPVTLLGFGVIAVGFALLAERELATGLARYRGGGR